MAQKQPKAQPQTPEQQNTLARVGRMVACVLSMGMIYPNAFVEDMNFKTYDEAGQQESQKK